MPCVSLTNPTYRPQVTFISSITKEQFGIVTTSSDHGYPPNIYVRFYIPNTYGMSQINEMIAIIAPLNATQFIMSIDTTHFDTFVVPGNPKQCAQVVPIAEFATTLEGAVRNVL